MCIFRYFVFFIFFVVNSFASQILFFSQNGQDEWVINEVFEGKRGGYFVELAASDGIVSSNTLTLEKFFNWKGICIEPNPIFFEQLTKNRKNAINLNVCIDGENHEVEFRYDNRFRGGIIDDDTDNNFKYRAEQIENAYKNNKVITLQTKTLEQILDDCNAPKVIDFLSLDIEGAETRCMRNFPFDKYTFLAMVIERPTEELNRILFENGYVFVKNSKKLNPYDSCYVHKSIENFEKIEKEPFYQVSRKNF